MPIAVLTLSLRRWRPLPVAAIALALAFSWNVSPLAYSFFADPPRPVGAAAATGSPSSATSTRTLTPDYRVEAVGTSDHWEAVYLPQAGIPIVRGWFRQNDFPQNELLYDKLDAAHLPARGSAG